ncbi:hypothetical protein MLD38_035237 [Melastoma candidum]|uniref:Uncharacterized protein n=1 Tax=Melastoma candidum TaxID=119954 RepID=A0ACB9MCN0_9MYRT|nr:hypothetical protein MLD38_035237 [Melastoma candidum]
MSSSTLGNNTQILHHPKCNASTNPIQRKSFPCSPWFSAYHQRPRPSSVAFCLPKPPDTHISPVSIIRSSSSPQSSAPKPPASREEAVLQAKTCIATTLEKPLNNPNPRLTGRFKKLKQPKFRVEIPLIDDSPESLVGLASEVFRDLPIKRKGPPVRILLLWPNPESLRNALESCEEAEVLDLDMSSLTAKDNVTINSADVGIVLGPDSAQLDVLKAVTEQMHPKPVVIFNPRWAFEDEESLGEVRNFVRSFEVIYSFVGLEVRGILSKRKGVIFKSVRDGVVSGERWSVLVEEGEGELKVVSSFQSRPSIGEVENVLYNLMAMNSPITKSAKFLRELVSNVTGKK